MITVVPADGSGRRRTGRLDHPYRSRAQRAAAGFYIPDTETFCTLDTDIR